MTIGRQKWGAKKWGTFKWGGDSGVIIGTTEYVEVYDLFIEDILTQEVNTCSFAVTNTFANRPRVGQEVKVIWKGSTLFGGRVTAVESAKLYSEQGNRTNNLHLFSVSCEDFAVDLKRYLVAYSWESSTLYDIVNDIVNTTSPYSTDTTETLASLGFTINSDLLSATKTGADVSKVSFNYKTPFECFTELCRLLGFDWYVDYDRKLHFFTITTALNESPIALVDEGTNFFDLTFVPEDISQIRNRIYVRGGNQLSALYTQTIVPNGWENSVTLDYVPFATSDWKDIVTLTVDGNPKTWAIENIQDTTGVDFVLSPDNRTLKSKDFGLFVGGEVVVLTYYYQIPLIIRIDDVESQTALKALCGGTGIFEHIVIDQKINTRAWAVDRARQELAEYANPVVNGTFRTQTMNIRSGQRMSINLTDRGFAATQYFLTRRVVIESIGGKELLFTVEFSTIIRDFNALLMRLLDYVTDKVLRDDEQVDKIYTSAEVVNVSDATTTTVSAPNFKWSADDGSTPNKLRWSVGEWG